MEYALGGLLGVAVTMLAMVANRRGWLAGRGERRDRADWIATRLRAHFQGLQPEQVSITQREFPHRVRADLQLAVDQVVGQVDRVAHFSGIRRQYASDPVALAECLSHEFEDRILPTAPEYEEVEVGEPRAIRVLKSGLWLFELDGVPVAMLLVPTSPYADFSGTQVQLAVEAKEEAVQLVEQIFRQLELVVEAAHSYRGKILSLERQENYSGRSGGITVHRLKSVAREEVILPKTTLGLLDRNVVEFARQRPALAALGQATKKGLLFHGPPGTGKTHTIHYLAHSLPDHTTLLITAEQVGLLDEYMTLARLLQPSIVVLEDVDLIARNRTQMRGACDESLLNRLLNEMDGLKADSQILFLLTTNRPDTLEAALASRPGRIDQAIEFPLPDAEGRQKLVRLYAGQLPLPDPAVHDLVERTAGVSAAFIKELLRRISQYYLQRQLATGEGTDRPPDEALERPVSQEDVDQALDEMLFQGGVLNVRLLGGNLSEQVE